MQVNEYQKAAMATLNPALDKKAILINSVMGLCGESGEAIDIVKKWLMQCYRMPDETALRELSESVIEKLKLLTDAEFAELEFPPD
mgnify:CR=1 FL=1